MPQLKIAGLDEAGRGAWAGPLVVAIVYLNKPIKDLDDSKKLTVKKRELLYEEIVRSAIFGIGLATSSQVDDLGLTKAQEQACQQALEECGLPADYKLIIDGNYNFIKERPNTVCEIKADQKYACVSAASIVAKVTRDRYMSELDSKFSDYKFSKHKGYGTALHKSLLEQHGPCPEHRQSFKPVADLQAHMVT